VRLQSITKSPIASTFTDIIKGLAEIRSMKLKEFFTEQLRHRQNENLVNGVLMTGTQSWFNLRVAICNVLLVQAPCYAYLVWQLTKLANIESVTLIIIYASNVTIDAINLFSMITDLETCFVSVERCSNFEKIQPEESYTNFEEEEKNMIKLGTKNDKIIEQIYAPPLKVDQYKIVKTGNVEFCNVSAKYPGKDENVLTRLNFSVKAGEKIGVVGRTGAGKTSLIKLFWRC